MKRTLCFTMLVLASIITKAQKDSDTVKSDTATFTSTMVTANFPGGISAWNAYLQQNLKANLGRKYLKIQKGETEARQDAIMSFLVDTSGNIFEVKCENASDVHPKLAAESIRVIKEGPKWIPATINGKKVVYRQRQSITWLVQKG